MKRLIFSVLMLLVSTTAFADYKCSASPLAVYDADKGFDTIVYVQNLSWNNIAFVEVVWRNHIGNPDPRQNPDEVIKLSLKPQEVRAVRIPRQFHLVSVHIIQVDGDEIGIEGIRMTPQGFSDMKFTSYKSWCTTTEWNPWR
jgi:hypothetical protein